MNKLFSVFNTTKKKLGATILSGALILAIGTGVSFAAEEGPKTPAPNPPNLHVKTIKGITEYSTDGGKTWSKTPPKGVTVKNDKGRILVKKHKIHKDKPIIGNTVKGKPVKHKIVVKKVNGITQISIDGGKTWSKTPPKGFHVLENKDGIIKIDSQPPKIEIKEEKAQK